MRIAIFTDVYLPLRGGTQTSIHNQKLMLEQAGHTVTVFTTPHPDAEGRADIVTVQGLNFTTKRGEQLQLTMPTPTKQIRHELINRHIELVHVQTDFGVGISGVVAAKKLNLPLVSTFHTLLWEQIQTRPRGEQLAVHIFEAPMQKTLTIPENFHIERLPGERSYAYKFRRHVCLLASQADVIISPSPHMAEKFKAWLPTQTVVTSPNTVTTPPRQNPLPAVPTFLWMGRMMPEKRVLDFCYAIRLIGKYTSLPFRAVVVGDGSDLDEASELLRDIHQATITGSIPNEQINSYIDNASALVMTSQGFDNQPMVITETIVGGRGFISMDSDLVEDVSANVGVFPGGTTPDDLARSLAELIEQPHLLQRMSDAAAVIAPYYNAAQGLERQLNAYQQALQHFPHS